MDVRVTFVSVNRRGLQQRDQRRVAGPLLNIGRGSQCQIHLPDPRVALLHAQVSLSLAGAVLEAVQGSVEVNAQVVSGAKLAVGDRIGIGPYELQVDESPAAVELALSVTLLEPLEVASSESQRIGVRKARWSRRSLSYVAFIATLIVCLLLPILPEVPGYPALLSAAGDRESTNDLIHRVAANFQQGWNPGPVSQSHQIFGSDCRACHKNPFVQVQNVSCISCHEWTREHVPVAQLTGAKGDEFRDVRCAHCHRDHKGMKMAPRAQDQCVECHRDVHAIAADAQSAKVTDFKTEHPEFRLSLVDADSPDAIRRVGRATPGEMVERSNLKFNHKVHLDRRGIRSLDGIADAGVPRAKEGPRVVLDCADCHKLPERGDLMAPVTMDLHCRTCHSLAFEPKVTKRQVVHGSETGIATMLHEFYARIVLGDVPPDVYPPGDLPRLRPGAVTTYDERQQALRLANLKADTVLRELFVTRKVCSTCHTINRTTEDPGWKVAPVRLTKTWMPHASFSHARHATEKCSKCHDVVESKSAGDIAMPKLAVCRDCHVGARPVLGKVTSDCALCHRFHDGRDYWPGAKQVQLARKVTP